MRVDRVCCPSCGRLSKVEVDAARPSALRILPHPLDSVPADGIDRMDARVRVDVIQNCPGSNALVTVAV